MWRERNIPILLDDKYVSWNKIEIINQNISIYVIGYVFIESSYYEKAAYAEFLEKIILSSRNNPFDNIKSIIPNLNGAWSLIIQYNADVLVAVDRSGARYY